MKYPDEQLERIFSRGKSWKEILRRAYLLGRREEKDKIKQKIKDKK